MKMNLPYLLSINFMAICGLHIILQSIQRNLFNCIVLLKWNCNLCFIFLVQLSKIPNESITIIQIIISVLQRGQKNKSTLRRAQYCLDSYYSIGGLLSMSTSKISHLSFKKLSTHVFKFNISYKAFRDFSLGEQ
jgi:hypothetical protein